MGLIDDNKMECADTGEREVIVGDHLPPPIERSPKRSFVVNSCFHCPITTPQKHKSTPPPAVVEENLPDYEAGLDRLPEADLVSEHVPPTESLVASARTFA